MRLELTHVMTNSHDNSVARNLDTMGIAGMAFVVLMSIVILGLLFALLWFFINVIRSKSAASQTLEYKKLVEDIEQQHQRTNESLSQVVADVADTKDRLASVERMMREVS